MRRFLNWLSCLLRRPLRLLAAVGLLVCIGLSLFVGAIHLWAEYHYRACLTSLARYHLIEAHEHVQCCLKARPRSGPFLLLAGRVARQMGQFEAAERYYNKTQHELNINDSLTLERVLLNAQRGGMDKAAPYLRSLVEQDHPQTPLILEAMARGHMQAFRLHEAGFLLELWLTKEPDSVPAHLFRAWVEEQQNAFQLAVDDYEWILDRDPDHDEAHLRIANALVELFQYLKALPHIEYVLQKLPDNVLIRVHLARCQNDLGHFDQARATLDAVLAEHPRNTPALVARARIAVQDGAIDKAEKWLRRALAIDPTDYQAQFLLCKCLQEAGNIDEAAREQARLKSIEQDVKRIQEIVTKKLSETPNDPQLHYEVGELFLRRGNTKEGLRWLESALAKDSHHAGAHAALADYYERINDMPKAVMHRELLKTTAGGAAAPPTSTAHR